MESNVILRPDSAGDTFCKKYGAYVKGDHAVVENNLRQFEENYAKCFGDIPDPEQAQKAIEFVGLFFAEIAHQNPKCREAAAVSGLAYLLDDSPLETIENISNLKIR